MKTPRTHPADLTTADLERILLKAEGLEREIIQQALHCSKTSHQWIMAASIYNRLQTR